MRPLYLAERVLAQDRHQRGRKIYSLHAPEVECIGKGKAHKPYEFGVKVSVATPLRHSRGGQFVAHVAALPGNPYDGHTLATVIPAMQAIIGNTLDRIIADAGIRGHNASPEYQFKVYTAGQKRRISPQIKRDMRRRAAVEPVIGHLKDDHRMGRNYLAHSSGDAINAVLAAVGYNFRLLLRWLRLLLSQILTAIVGPAQLSLAEKDVLHGRLATLKCPSTPSRQRCSNSSTDQIGASYNGWIQLGADRMPVAWEFELINPLNPQDYIWSDGGPGAHRDVPLRLYIAEMWQQTELSELGKLCLRPLRYPPRSHSSPPASAR